MSDPKASLERFIRWVMRDTLYLATYDATVQRQHDDDSLDLLPDDARIRGTGLSRVTIRHGLPGVRCRVVVGARVQLGFEAGDPQRPYAALWEPGSIEQLIFDDGLAPVARYGDPIEAMWPATLQITGTILETGGAVDARLTIGTVSAGTIRSGAERVKA